MTGKKNWRLSKTLRRRTEFRPIENGDVKYAWAAYKQGKLPQLDFPEDLSAPDFKTAFEAFVLTRTHAAWTILAETAKGFLPVGIILGHWGPDRAFMILSGIAWYPWASRRNIIEGTVNFSNIMRKQLPVIGFANDEHRPLYEACCMHGIMRRIGTSHVLGKKLTIFEGRT